LCKPVSTQRIVAAVEEALRNTFDGAARPGHYSTGAPS
jgi:hypothetical protein